MTSNYPQNDPAYYRVGNPPQGPTAPPPKKKPKTLWIVLGTLGAVVLVCCGIGTIMAATGGLSSVSAENSADTGSPAQPEGAAPAAVAKIGSPVRDGQFEFTVTEVACGQSKVGSQYLNKTAQGQFCLVTVQVKNIGKEARTFDASNQSAVGAGEVKYSSDGVASLYVNENNEAFLNEINPGNSITAKVVFDIPKDGKLVMVVLHDSAFSGGTKVSLG